MPLETGGHAVRDLPEQHDARHGDVVGRDAAEPGQQPVGVDELSAIQPPGEVDEKLGRLVLGRGEEAVMRARHALFPLAWSRCPVMRRKDIVAGKPDHTGLGRRSRQLQRLLRRRPYDGRHARRTAVDAEGELERPRRPSDTLGIMLAGVTLIGWAWSAITSVPISRAEQRQNRPQGA